MSTLVYEHHGCPRCGERRMDYLVIDEDNHVHCYNCNSDYNI